MEINICDEVIKTMKIAGISENNISKIENNPTFVNIRDKDIKMQRITICHMFLKILLSGNIDVPQSVRLHLNASSDILAWLEDIKVSIIPFIKENEDKFNFN